MLSSFCSRELTDRNAKITKISPNFLVWKRSEKAHFWANRPKLCGNCEFPQNIHTKKLGEIRLFDAMNVLQYHHVVRSITIFLLCAILSFVFTECDRTYRIILSLYKVGGYQQSRREKDGNRGKFISSNLVNFSYKKFEKFAKWKSFCQSKATFIVYSELVANGCVQIKCLTAHSKCKHRQNKMKICETNWCFISYF